MTFSEKYCKLKRFLCISSSISDNSNYIANSIRWKFVWFQYGESEKSAGYLINLIMIRLNCIMQMYSYSTHSADKFRNHDVLLVSIDTNFYSIYIPMYIVEKRRKFIYRVLSFNVHSFNFLM